MVTGSLEIVKKERKGEVGVYFVNSARKIHKPASSVIQQVLLHLDECYDTQVLWLSHIATLMNVHPDYLGKRFKREVGIRFHEYLLLKRVQIR